MIFFKGVSTVTGWICFDVCGWWFDPGLMKIIGLFENIKTESLFDQSNYRNTQKTCKYTFDSLYSRWAINNVTTKSAAAAQIYKSVTIQDIWWQKGWSLRNVTVVLLIIFIKVVLMHFCSQSVWWLSTRGSVLFSLFIECPRYSNRREKEMWAPEIMNLSAKQNHKVTLP